MEAGCDPNFRDAVPLENAGGIGTGIGTGSTAAQWIHWTKHEVTRNAIGELMIKLMWASSLDDAQCLEETGLSKIVGGTAGGEESSSQLRSGAAATTAGKKEQPFATGEQPFATKEQMDQTVEYYQFYETTVKPLMEKQADESAVLFLSAPVCPPKMANGNVKTGQGNGRNLDSQERGLNKNLQKPVSGPTCSPVILNAQDSSQIRGGQEWGDREATAIAFAPPDSDVEEELVQQEAPKKSASSSSSAGFSTNSYSHCLFTPPISDRALTAAERRIGQTVPYHVVARVPPPGGGGGEEGGGAGGGLLGAMLWKQYCVSWTKPRDAPELAKLETEFIDDHRAMLKAKFGEDPPFAAVGFGMVDGFRVDEFVGREWAGGPTYGVYCVDFCDAQFIFFEEKRFFWFCLVNQLHHVVPPSTGMQGGGSL